MREYLPEIAALLIGVSVVVAVVWLDTRRRRSLDPAAVRRFPLLRRFIGVRRIVALEVVVPKGSGLVGVAVAELRLPEPAVVALLWRRGEAVVAHRTMTLQVGDRLWVVTPAALRPRVVERMRDVALRGRLADWHADLPPGRPSPGVPGGTSGEGHGA